MPSWKLWLRRPLGAQHGIEEAGKGGRKVKRQHGTRARRDWIRTIKWETDTNLKHNRLISERLWEGIQIFTWTTKLLPACELPSHLEEGLDLSFFICHRKRRGHKWPAQRTLEVPLSPNWREWRGVYCLNPLSTLVSATGFILGSACDTDRRGKGHRAGKMARVGVGHCEGGPSS